LVGIIQKAITEQQPENLFDGPPSSPTLVGWLFDEIFLYKSIEHQALTSLVICTNKYIKITSMQKLQFKTNIKCGGCTAAVKPHLDGATAITAWEVDVTNPDKILTVTTDLTAEAVVAIVKGAGYQATQL
jgi:copper chaperone